MQNVSTPLIAAPIAYSYGQDTHLRSRHASLTHSLTQLQAWFVAAIFVLLAIPVTIYEVAMHLEYFSRPALQIHVIRILWMVPIYAMDAWLALRFKVGLLCACLPSGRLAGWRLHRMARELVCCEQGLQDLLGLK